METLTLDLFPYENGDGPHNMAADEALLWTAAHEHKASLRFYGWTQATVSLGYFQPFDIRASIPALATLSWVRRASGGAMLVHHHELTYCLALPPGLLVPGGEPLMRKMHRVIGQALEAMGMVGLINLVDVKNHTTNQPLCFQQQTPGDLASRGSKVVGSAQRKYRQAIMQHGSILVSTSPFAPQLPGLRELTGHQLPIEDLQQAISSVLAKACSWNIQPAAWSSQQLQVRHRLEREKYAAQEWNEKR